MTTMERQRSAGSNVAFDAFNGYTDSTLGDPVYVPRRSTEDDLFRKGGMGAAWTPAAPEVESTEPLMHSATRNDTTEITDRDETVADAASDPVDRTPARAQVRAFFAGVAALQKVALAQRPEPDDWFLASRELRSAAVAMKARAPRAASLALLVSDALTFTSPDEMTPERLQPLRDGYAVLSGRFFVETEVEEQVFQGFLDYRWHTVAPYTDPRFEGE